jgi:anti-sigma factor RsiW
MDYVSGALSASERAVFEEHLGECPDCVAYLSTYQKTIELGKAACLADDPVPADVPEELVQAILAARARNSQAPKG